MRAFFQLEFQGKYRKTKTGRNLYKMQKVLITPSSFGESGSKPLDILKSNGFTFQLNPYKRKLKKLELLELADNCKWIIAGVEEYSVEVLDRLESLECISRVGVGLDGIDLKKAEEKGIKVLNTPYGPTEAVAELALALALNLLRKVNLADANLKKGIWKKVHGSLLSGKTVGIVGFGRIGQRVAGLLRPFRVKIIYHDPYLQLSVDDGYESVSFDHLLENSNIIILHLSWTKESSRLVGEKELSRMKNDAYLINLSRGGVIDERSLYESLKRKEIAGAALDVFENEPYSGELIKLENTILTPHIGSYAKEAKLKMEIDAVNNLMSFIKESR